MEVTRTGYAPVASVAQSATGEGRRIRRARVGFDQAGEERDGLSARRRPEGVRVGFGADSVKLPSVAATTIKRNVGQAKELVPTLEESSARVRERLDEDARRLREREEAPTPTLDLTSPREAAVNAARSFVSGLNAAAGRAQSRTGLGEPEPEDRLDIRIGDVRVPLEKSSPRLSLDILA